MPAILPSQRAMSPATISPEQTSLVMLAQHRIGEAGFCALCSDGASLFLFSEMGIT